MPGGTKATHTMGLGIRLLVGMKKHYRELDIVRGLVVRGPFLYNVMCFFGGLFKE